MRKEDFRQWLEGRIKKKPISDCLSRCTTVEYALKVDLDEEYKKDKGQAVIAKLSYNARDAKANLPVPQEFKFKEGQAIESMALCILLRLHKSMTEAGV